MTDQKEIERVKVIHQELDQIHEFQRDELKRWLNWTILHEDASESRYTADEIREWPENKAAMVEMLRRNISYAGALLTPGFTSRAGGFWLNVQAEAARPDEFRRGLVMYREMLEPRAVINEQTLKEAARRVFNESWNAAASEIVNHAFASVPSDPSDIAVDDDEGDVVTDQRWAEALARLKASFISAQPILPVDTDTPLHQSRIKVREVKDPYTGHDIAADKLVAARTYDHPTNVQARKIAALRAELDRPVAHPVEGRSERALPRRNGR